MTMNVSWLALLATLVTACSASSDPSRVGGTGGMSAIGAAGGVNGAAGSAAASDGGMHLVGPDGGASGGGAVGGAGGRLGEVDAGADAERSGDARAGDASDGGVPPADAGTGLVPIFNGSNLDGWIQVPAGSWSVVAGAMHSLAPARGFIYTRATYGDFRMVFTSRLVADPAAHLPCVLFWGNSPTVDALAGIQVQPPRGYMWDYRRTGSTAGQSPDRYETRLGGLALNDMQWSQGEILTNRAAGTMRFACFQLGTNARCKGVEIVDFKDPTAGIVAPVALQVHNAGMIEEFKDVYLESPVADPATLITTQWP